MRGLTAREAFLLRALLSSDDADELDPCSACGGDFLVCDCESSNPLEITSDEESSLLDRGYAAWVASRDGEFDELSITPRGALALRLHDALVAMRGAA